MGMVFSMEGNFGEDWEFSINSYEKVEYGELNRRILMDAEDITNIETILDIGCGPEPISNCFYDPILDNIKRTLVDKDPHIHKLCEKLEDSVDIIQFDLNDIDKENSQEFREKVLDKRWNLIIASNILSYINWTNVLKELSNTQESSDIIYIQHKENMGYNNLFHETDFSPSLRNIIKFLKIKDYKIIKVKDSYIADHILAQKI